MVIFVVGLADIMKKLLIRYDNLFETSFPYSMGWHGKLRILQKLSVAYCSVMFDSSSLAPSLILWFGW